MIPVEKIDVEEQPIYYLAGNARSIQGSSTENFDLEVLINKYEFVLVIYVSLKEKVN